MIDQDITIYSRSGLEGRTVEDLQPIAASFGVAYSDLLKDELIDAILLAQAGSLASLVAASAVLGDQQLTTTVVEHEERLNALDNRVAALDTRTRPATNPLT